MLFIEGTFRLNNQMLSDLRAAGHYEGYGQAMVEARRWKRRQRGRDLFAEEVQAIRLAVKANARGVSWSGGKLNVSVVVVGHCKHDPDAWLLLGKAAIDGLVDAGVFCSDRFGLGTLTGRVLQSAEEAREAFELADAVMGEKAPHSSCKGFFLLLSSPSLGVGHA